MAQYVGQDASGVRNLLSAIAVLLQRYYDFDLTSEERMDFLLERQLLFSDWDFSDARGSCLQCACRRRQ